MAGDWIKVRTDLCDCTKVRRIARVLGAPRASVVGGVVMLWAMADAHTTNGLLKGLTLADIDDTVGVPGLAAALADPLVDWARETDKGVLLPRWGEHNGKTAKKRAQDARRQARKRDREGPENVTPTSRSGATDRGEGRDLEQEQSRAEQSSREQRDIAAEKGKAGPQYPDNGGEHEPPMLRSSEQRTLCSLLLAAGLGLTANEAAGIAQEPRATLTKGMWALERLKDQQGKAASGRGDPVRNPAGYVRGLVQGDQGPPAAWVKANARKVLALAGAKGAVAGAGGAA